MAKNRISVEVRDIEGELFITSASNSNLNGGQKSMRHVMQLIILISLFSIVRGQKMICQLHFDP